MPASPNPRRRIEELKRLNGYLYRHPEELERIIREIRSRPRPTFPVRRSNGRRIITFKAPEDLYERVLRFARARGMSMGQVVREAILYLLAVEDALS